MGDAAHDSLIGRTIGGYLIVDKIASGGMGRIYRAEQTKLARSVAVKVIHPWLVSDEMSVSRFITEACAASRLQHPNSVAIHDFGETEDHLLYLVMELLRGEDLARLVARAGLLPIPRLVDIVRQALAAIDEAHALSIVHRDIKPENFVIERTRSGHDRVKLVDFGIAKIRSVLVGRKSTMPGTICGTPEYMSPEQARGEPLDGRSDLYSVGVVLYELLTGRLPFDGSDRASIAVAHVQDTPADPRKVAPERCIPDKLAVLVLRTLAKRPEDRPTTARELADALEDAIAPGEGSPAHPSAKFCADWLKHHRAAATATTQAAVAAATTQPSARRRASSSRVALLAVGVAAALASAPLTTVVLHAQGRVSAGAPLAMAAVTGAGVQALALTPTPTPTPAIESQAAPRADVFPASSGAPRSIRPVRSAHLVPAASPTVVARPATPPSPAPPTPVDKSEVL